MSVSTVSATGIQDPTGQVFANGTWRLEFVPTYGTPGIYNDGGLPFTKQYGGSLDATGSFSQAGVNRSDTIAPAGSQWRFTAIPAVNGTTYSVLLNVNTPAFDVTAAINAVITNIVVSPTNISRAYKDAELVNVDGSGALYYDETLKVLKVWDAVSGVWISVNTVGSVLAPNGTAAAPGFSFSNESNSGLFRVSAGVLGWSILGSSKFIVNANAWIGGSGEVFGWSSNADPTLAAADTGWSRISAKVIAAGSGTPGDATGTVRAANFFSNGAVTGAAVGDVGTSRTSLTGMYWLGTDGTVGLFRSGATSVSLHSSAGEMTIPLANDVLVAQATANTLTNKTIPQAGLSFAGSVSGTTSLQPSPTAGGIAQLPAITGTDTLAAIATTQTITNKRVTPRAVVAADGVAVTPNSDTTDIVTFVSTQIAGTLTINAPTGTPTDGQKLVLRLKSTNAQTYSFNATFAFSASVTAPTTLAAGKTDYIGLMWNGTNTKWDVVAVDQGH